MMCRISSLAGVCPFLAVVSLSAQQPAVPSLYEQARAASQRGQVDSAYDLIRRAAEAEPGRAEVQYMLGQVACDKAGRAGALSAYGLARKCKAAFARAVQLAPDSVDYLEGFARYLAQAPGIVGGDKDSALKLAERVRLRDEVRGAFLLAGLWWPGNAASKARSDSVVQSVAERHAADRDVQLRVGGWWAGTNRAERALATYEGLVSRDPKDAVARFFLGRQLVLMKREQRRAQDHLRFAAAAQVPAPGPGVNSFTPGAPWWRLGQSYVQLGMSDSARICYERALQVNPQLQQARASLDSLARH
jgi:tetratricopeptide (TPR) repeat protein